MVRHNLAAWSLRHLRFARRMMAGQPLLVRADYPSYAPAYVSLAGYQLPVGRVLRYLPRADTAWLDDAALSSLPTSDLEMSPGETLLRLLPRLPESDVLPAEASAGQEPGPDAWLPIGYSGQSLPRRPLDDVPSQSPLLPVPSSSGDSELPMSVVMRSDGPRPRSRIVELPGVISLPVESDASGEGSSPDDHPDVGANADAESLASASETETPPISDAGKLPSVVQEGAAPMARTEAPPAPAPRHRRGQHAVSPPRASDALFPPTGGDRSPQTWLARLQRAEMSSSAAPTALTPPDDEPPSPTGPRPGSRSTRKGHRASRTTRTATPPTPPAQSPTAVVEQPVTLPASSRALLHTMTGVDPADVRIYRGSEAGRVTAAQNADALTDGSAIALGAGHATDTPETLGLLAHELTHVAQRRNPRFVPPVALPPASQRHPLTKPPATPPATLAPVTSPADAEAQAAQVEARVTTFARARNAAPGATRLALPEQPEAPEQPVSHAAPARPSQPQPNARPIWGNLPAPWEPLPDWMAGPAGEPPAEPQLSSPPAHPSFPAPPRAPSADTAGVQRAERGRSLPAGASEPSSATSTAAREGGVPEPDLDALARQVHAILKRRLAAERRRFG